MFVGVAVQPAVADTPISSYNEEDCDICPKVSKLKVVEKYQELSDRIWSFPISCGILFIFASIIANIANVLYNLPRQPWKVLTTLAAFFCLIGMLGAMIGCWEFSLNPFEDDEWR